MNRETIERAAMETARKACANYDEAFEYANGFVTGAHWRINSVWHDYPEEKPQADVIVLAETRCGICALMKKDPLEWDLYAQRIGVIRWAYVSDLLPDRKEDDR